MLIVSNLLTITTPEPERKKSGKKSNHGSQSNHVQGNSSEGKLNPMESKLITESPTVPSQGKKFVPKLPSLASVFSFTDPSFDGELSDPKKSRRHPDRIHGICFNRGLPNPTLPDNVNSHNLNWIKFDPISDLFQQFHSNTK